MESFAFPDRIDLISTEIKQKCSKSKVSNSSSVFNKFLVFLGSKDYFGHSEQHYLEVPRIR